MGTSSPVDGWTVNYPFFPDPWGRVFHPNVDAYVWSLNNLGLNGGAGPFRMSRTISMRAGCIYRFEMTHTDIIGLSSMQAVFSVNVNGVSIYDYSVVSYNFLPLHSVSMDTEPLETDLDVEFELMLARVTNSSWPVMNVAQLTISEIRPYDFNDEQRGFWAKLWDFLTGMWDAIKAIPEKIGEFFQNLIDTITGFFRQVWDISRMIFEWILAIVRLIVKSAQVMGAVIGGLPWWMTGGTLALVAVCVVYKILGREPQG